MSRKKNRLPSYQEEPLKVNFKYLTKKQEELGKSIRNNEITIAIGPSGTGKTYCALQEALNLLGDKYKRIVLVKSVVAIKGEELGYGKGTYEEKIAPYMMSFIGNIDKILDKKGSAEDLIKKGLIEILPIAFIRGITQDDCIVLLDEFQNFTDHTFKSLITRIGSNCKYIFFGDIEQVDRSNKNESCAEKVVDIFKDSDVISVLEFTDDDCVRNPIIPKILTKLREGGL